MDVTIASVVRTTANSSLTAYLILLLIDAHTLERGIVAAVIRQRLIVKVHHVGDHIVDKVAVVRHDEQRLGVGLQIVLEPQHGWKIEVVLPRSEENGIK